MTTAKDQKSSPAPSRGAHLHRDLTSFQKPLDQAVAACTAVLTGSMRKVAGAEAALRAAMNDFKALDTFTKTVETHIEAASFHNLPVLRKWGRRIPGLHQLTCEPFRGVFLIGDDPQDVTALLFSRKPHDVSTRLNELVVSYRTEAQERAREDT